jgi:hypothetical protein
MSFRVTRRFDALGAAPAQLAKYERPHLTVRPCGVTVTANPFGVEATRAVARPLLTLETVLSSSALAPAGRGGAGTSNVYERASGWRWLRRLRSHGK